MKSFALIAVPLAFAVAELPRPQSARPTTPAQPASGAVIHERDVTVPMRDGVLLRADILRPGPGRFPTLVYRTPYGKHEALQNSTTFKRAVGRGYAVIVQDVRGRYKSNGEFRPYESEGRDGYDTIEWAARQLWSDGHIGTFGLSYPGAVQWLAAIESPPHLDAMIPAMTFSSPQNFFYSGGIWDLSWAEWIWQDIAPDARARKRLPPQERGWKDVKNAVLGTLPLDQLAELRDVAPYYYEWLHHPPDDPFWDFAELRGKYGRTRAAVLNLSGWHDDNYGPEGATTNYSGLVHARSGDSSRVGLLIGPWSHGVDATARTRFGDIDFGPSAAIDYDEVVLKWMDRFVRGKGDDESRQPVRYFVMGANQWKGSATWPPPASPRIFYLSSFAMPRRGNLSTTQPARESVSEFVSNPANPVTNPFASAGAHDYRRLAERDDVLTFDSDPVSDDLEVTGPVRIIVHLSCDCRDTDLWARLLDIAPDGSAHNLMSPGSEALRASFRNEANGRQLLTPGDVYELRFDRLVTSNTFQRGHRIRVQLSSTFFPNFSRNLHTGELETVSARMKTTTIRTYYDPGHPSRIELPIVK